MARFFQYSLVVALGLLASCGLIKDSPKRGKQITKKLIEHRSVGLIREGDIECLAFLAGSADQAITLTKCSSSTVWFRDDFNQEIAVPVISTKNLGNGVSSLKLARSVNPYFLKMEGPYSGWDRKKMRLLLKDSYADCDGFRDGTHYCQATPQVQGAPLVDLDSGKVLGVHSDPNDCAQEYSDSCKFEPSFLWWK